jgi:dTDP-4-amino-4,6-dideoxygalactose transaminase
MDELQRIAQRHGLALFEDAAQAHGASYRGRPAGSLARAAAFSFYPSKNLGALGDAGAICTNDRHVAEQARTLRDLGRGDSGAHLLAGYNERLDGLQAAFLRVKLAKLDAGNGARRTIAERYRAALNDVELLVEAPEAECVYHLFPIRIEGRDSVARLLAARGVATGIHYPLALPDQPALGRWRSPDPAPVARDWAARELSLPMFPGMTEREVDAVLSALQATRDGGKGGDSSRKSSLLPRSF